MSNQVEIVCYDCGGQGWIVTYSLSGYPDQEECWICKGEKKLMVDERFARMMNAGASK